MTALLPAPKHGLPPAALRVLRLCGYVKDDWSAYGSSLQELEIDTLPALPQLEELMLYDLQVCSNTCRTYVCAMCC